MKRQKPVFPTDEIAHLWAHQTQDSAKNPGHNFYFEGATIYSYGSHFPIASWADNKRKQRAILFITRGYSVTTSRHINMVRGAIPRDVTVFNVPTVSTNSWSLLENADYFRREIADSYAEAMKGSKGLRAKRIRQMLSYQKDALAYVKFFSLKGQRFTLPIKPKALKTLMAQAVKDEKTHNASVRDRYERKQAANREKWAAHQRQREADELERQRTLGERIESWRTGKVSSSVFGYGEDVPTMLRIDNGEVVTSKGARFPLEHAKRGLQLVKAVMARGEQWQTNGHSCHLGHYRIETIEPNGTVAAGCHVVPWDEIARIADQIESV